MVFIRNWIFLIGLLLHHCLQTCSADALANLTEEWELGELYNRNKGHCIIQDSLSLFGGVTGYVVVKDGVIVSEDYNNGHNATELTPVFSTTKSWTSTLIGYMVQEGMVDINDNLGNIFNNETDWVDIEDASEKQSITLFELLTMTGGLKDTPGDADQLRTRTARNDEEESDIDAQRNLTEVLNKMIYDESLRGEFNYLATVHILSRVIFRASGMTPGELAVESGIFPALGIQQSNYSWDTWGDVEGSAYGFRSNPRTQAKLGQLVLQKGYVAEGVSIIDPNWAEAAVDNQLPTGVFGFLPIYWGYGYQWWTDLRRDFLPIARSTEGAYSALGYNGNFISVFPEINTVITITSDGEELRNYFLLHLILDNISSMDDEEDECKSQSIVSRARIFSSASFFLAQNVIKNFIEVLPTFLGFWVLT